MERGEVLLALYQRLYDSYGPQSWWPAETAFEIMLGAILTQNTAWTNVEKAIHNLKQCAALNIHTLLELPENKLAQLIRPSGYFNIKARRLKNFTQWFLDEGKFNRLNQLDDTELRNRLLSVNGVGPETADDILLYAFQRPVFVIDAYTRRLLLKLDLITGDEGYEALRQFFEQALDPDVTLFQEYHALIVRHAKQACSGEPACAHCHVEQLAGQKSG